MEVDPPSDEDFEDAQDTFNIEDDHFFDSDVTGRRRPEPLSESSTLSTGSKDFL